MGQFINILVSPMIINRCIISVIHPVITSANLISVCCGKKRHLSLHYLSKNAAISLWQNPLKSVNFLRLNIFLFLWI